MKFNFFLSSGRQAWQNNKPIIWFLLSLLFIHSVLKIIFYQYNHQLLFSAEGQNIKQAGIAQLAWYSLGADLLVLSGINIVLLLLMQAGRLFSKKIISWFVIPVFVLLNSLAILLNLVDVFYFRFHFQRANADLFYAIDHPLNRLMQQNFFLIALFLVLIAAVILLVWYIHKKLQRSFAVGRNCNLITLLLCGLVVFCFVFNNSFQKILLPTYPLVSVSSKQLPVVQNSFHTFIYSIFRHGQSLQPRKYMSDAACDSVLPIRKKLSIHKAQNTKPNIVLFIMESVPYDFFDSTSAYKVNMPFLDSLLQKSTIFSNAFCFDRQSTHGLTAILAGVPTLSDIPVYHSAQINMPVTHIGSALKTLGYQSLFCIGDEYDNFGFAKCANWMGIEKYYSKEDIPGYKNLPAHSMGLQDEAVLNFFEQQVSSTQQPFFATHYNISTHFPYDIPERFAKQLPAAYTKPMKAMLYYDYCLRQFFNHAKTQAWFANTVFIFCADHWLFPQGKLAPYNELSAYHIPIIIYNPLENKKQTINTVASQFDIAPTILAAAGYGGSIISYGNNLLDSNQHNKYVFARPGNSLYQVIDSSYIFGFNTVTGKAEFLYNYKKDTSLAKNIVTAKSETASSNRMQLAVKVFLQKATAQYSNNAFK